MRLGYIIVFGLSVSRLAAQTTLDKTMPGVINGIEMAPVDVQPLSKGTLPVSSPKKTAVTVSAPSSPLKEVSITREVKPLTGKEEFLTAKGVSHPLGNDSLIEVDVPAVEAIPMKRSQ